VGILEGHILEDQEAHVLMTTYDLRIARVQRTLRWFEEDIPLLNLRVRELSKERQESARKFATAMIDHTRAELERLLQERRVQNRKIERAMNVRTSDARTNDASQAHCEPAD
jgi:hypothetical protein